jgi:hypothetical protein
MKTARILATMLALIAARGLGAEEVSWPDYVLQFSLAPGIRVRLEAPAEVAVPGIVRLTERSGAIEDPTAAVVYEDKSILTLRCDRNPATITILRPNRILDAVLVSLDAEWVVVTIGRAEDPKRIPRGALRRVSVLQGLHWITVPPGPPYAVPGDHVHLALGRRHPQTPPAGSRQHIMGQLISLERPVVTVQTGTTATAEFSLDDGVEVDVERDGVWFRAEPSLPFDPGHLVAVVALRVGAHIKIAAQAFVEVPGWVSLARDRYQTRSTTPFRSVTEATEMLTLEKRDGQQTLTCPRPGYSVRGTLIGLEDGLWHIEREWKSLFVPHVPSLDVSIRYDGAWLPVVDTVRVDP